MASADLGPHGIFGFYGDSASSEPGGVRSASASGQRGFNGIVALARLPPCGESGYSTNCGFRGDLLGFWAEGTDGFGESGIWLRMGNLASTGDCVYER